MTAAELIEIWTERDRRYAMLPYALNREAAELIRSNRSDELINVKAGERSVAWHWLRDWAPPDPTKRRL